MGRKIPQCFSFSLEKDLRNLWRKNPIIRIEMRVCDDGWHSGFGFCQEFCHRFFAYLRILGRGDRDDDHVDMGFFYRYDLDCPVSNCGLFVYRNRFTFGARSHRGVSLARDSKFFIGRR